MIMLCKICSDGLKQGFVKCTFNNILSRGLYQTHYEVLNLPTDCTDKQIKSAFIKLSKEHHPDINKSEQAHTRFQKINEAYKVLGKPESRRNYDLGLGNPYYRGPSGPYYEHPMNDPYHDPSFWTSRDRRKDKFYENRAYYGIPGVTRVSNGAIVVCCLVLTFVGVIVQYLAISKSFTFKRDELIKKSLEIEQTLNETRAIAASNGNDKQLDALKIRLLGNDTKSD